MCSYNPTKWLYVSIQPPRELPFCVLKIPFHGNCYRLCPEWSLCAIDNRHILFMSLLECSAALDLVDPSILLHHLEQRLGLSGKPLNIFEHVYLIESSVSSSMERHPEPAALTAMYCRAQFLVEDCYFIYPAPRWYHPQTWCQLSSACRWYLIYLACRMSNWPHTHSETLLRLEACIADIQQWMLLNGLKLNDTKTEFMLI